MDFLDDKLDLQERRRMELHILECGNCRQETEKLQKIIGILGRMPRYAVPNNALELTHRRIEEASEQPTRAWLFRIPRWGAVSAAFLVLAILLVFLGNYVLFRKHEVDPIPVSVYAQEHAVTDFQRFLPPGVISALTAVPIEEVSEDQKPEEPKSELGMLLEVHYDTYAEVGS